MSIVKVLSIALGLIVVTASFFVGATHPDLVTQAAPIMLLCALGSVLVLLFYIDRLREQLKTALQTIKAHERRIADLTSGLGKEDGSLKPEAFQQ